MIRNGRCSENERWSWTARGRALGNRCGALGFGLARSALCSALRSALGCELSDANTMLGCGSDEVITTSVATRAVAAAGITNLGYAPRNRVPCRIGRSTKRKEP